MTSTAYLDQHFDRASDFIEFLLNISGLEPSQIFQATMDGLGGFIFRGQSSMEWPLLPAAHRPGDPLAQFTPQSPGKKRVKKTDRQMFLGMQLHAEIRAIHLFLESADKLGISTPIDYGLSLEHIDLLNALLNKKHHGSTEPFPSPKLLPSAALAQHHGIPTRLLDWSESPLVATYFAALGASSISVSKRKKKEENIGVVAMYIGNKNKLTDIEIVKAPRHANNFLLAQRGIFTYLPQANQIFLDNGQWPTIESTFIDNGLNRGWLRRATLPNHEADTVLKQLLKYDITRHHLMPSLANAAISFKYKHDLY